LQCVEEVDALLGGGGEVAPEGEERFGLVDAAEAARDFLVDFHHPDVSLCGVVVERDGEVGGEAQHVIGVEVEPSQEVP
jgi:hypothetical protein